NVFGSSAHLNGLVIRWFRSAKETARFFMHSFELTKFPKKELSSRFMNGGKPIIYTILEYVGIGRSSGVITQGHITVPLQPSPRRADNAGYYNDSPETRSPPKPL
ncbi:hypothetical protein PMAYCL1PPCAC_07820, partial [Pristionchus mayeri]